ncbi:phosphoadenylyl-sulfate reductase [Pseudaestuariivita atlantica]|uniref:Adenosine 5'-phosphosulfate reductase n=1 Tax=Pseudaestuariivita atlantica TaxID=1317121 RepID=A0A0L1JKV1_9RHOB|nr:phosphoadenylyl-sulfate reductase [Pseudaestuariivita atlantica]KNG92384.1 phosphoadenosine phosphosulfate reductase [Pseudaestuariivita atlantica]
MIHAVDFAPRAQALNLAYQEQAALSLLSSVLIGRSAGRVAVVSAFGADSVVILHLVSRIDPTAPVLFVDTEMLFAETLAYQREVAGALGLSNVQVLRGDTARDADNTLHLRDPDACCALRKTAPLDAALQGFDAWITGRKRYQGGQRADVQTFTPDPRGRGLTINPLATWAREEVQAYITRHDLPRHPLVAQGFRSIGCAPCTSRVAEGEDERAGRWRGQDKDECGIHIVDGKIVRGAA